MSDLTLIERLRRTVYVAGGKPPLPVNPDGPAAADLIDGLQDLLADRQGTIVDLAMAVAGYRIALHEIVNGCDDPAGVARGALDAAPMFKNEVAA